MNRAKLLHELHEQGVSEGADLNDGLDGWFGWRIHDDVLTVHFEDEESHRSQASWRLTPIEDHETRGRHSRHEDEEHEERERREERRERWEDLQEESEEERVEEFLEAFGLDE